MIINPVDESYFNIQRKVSNRIVTLGRLYEQKNHKLLIDAFKNSLDKINDDLYIYGEGSLRKKLEEYIDFNGLKNRVFLPGNTSKDYK